ncbi:sterol desaturase family protein [Echinicola salinicaeni]|uniref:sterol desaturase family protein n=1 Tax=Echinicola salinicaeni TaxID=2762757 RepID=UPI001646ECFD|nr:sterol desaturase family protein [Echinicola salinicaeni]
MINAILFVVIGFLLMEFCGWFIHKYLMHGVLWKVHKTHHEPSKGPFELNDIFSLLFGGVSILLMWKGFGDLDYRFWMGVGISLYGLSYFLLHDVLIHRRSKWLARPKKGIFIGIFRAHQAHHANNQKKGAEAFGLFVVPWKYFKEGKK